MTATPIFPGRAYRVRFGRQFLVVLAPHPCQALSIVSEALAVFGASTHCK